jgi:lipid-A-disaccharide synthase
MTAPRTQTLRAPRILVVAGEASGDAHAAAALAALRTEVPDLEAFGVGGDALIEAGLTPIAHARELAVVGLSEVLPRLPRILGILRALGAAARQRRPDLAILVDSPDFNLRVAKRLARLGVPVLYYIAPQVWAWRRGRLRTLRERVARLAVVFPFERAFFCDAGIATELVGHPLLDEGSAWPTKDEARTRLGLSAPEGHPKVVAVLPGSRRSEVVRHTAIMTLGARAFAGADGALLLPVASTMSREDVGRFIPRDAGPVRLLEGQSRLALAAADCAVVASGTATLEAALSGTPSVVGYKVSWLTYTLARWLVRTPFVAMPNLLAGREVFPELLQGSLTPARVAEALGDVSARSSQIVDSLDEVRAALGGPGAARRVASIAISLLRPDAVEKTPQA